MLENAGITVWRKLAGRLGLLARRRRARARLRLSSRKLEVRTPSLAQIVGNLSGGNQQKISVAKWLAAGVRILIVDEPSVGIDIKTKAYIHELLRQLADEGTAILLITSDMPEMITLADRIVVMDDYRIKGEIANDRDYAAMSERIMTLIHAATRPEFTPRTEAGAALRRRRLRLEAAAQSDPLRCSGAIDGGDKRAAQWGASPAPWIALQFTCPHRTS